jgi:predicted GIY-YIG superfamily endonuclease
VFDSIGETETEFGSDGGMRDEIVKAFHLASQGFSPDRVVADPDLNCIYLSECGRLGLGSDAATLNRLLLNLRKRGALRGVASRRTILKDQSDFRFAAEIAARFLERKYKITLDQIICDPEFAEQFDALTKTIVPGGKPFEYRWAALNLRKQRRLKPEVLARVAQPSEVLQFKVNGLSLTSVPNRPGLYLFYSNQATLYVGEAENLQNRIRKHLDHSDNKALARWLWEFGDASLHLELQVLEKSITQRIRRALETELIRSRMPVFNIRR